MKPFAVLFGGRFQPPHIGHYNVYKYLVDLFGKEKVYILTSNKTDNKKSPLNFEQKKKIWTEIWNVDENRICYSSNPVFRPFDFLEKLGTDYAFITVRGEKDQQKFETIDYFERFDMEKIDDLKSWPEKGYYMIVPMMGSVSGTFVRKLLNNPFENSRIILEKLYPNLSKLEEIIKGKQNDSEGIRL